MKDKIVMDNVNSKIQSYCNKKNINLENANTKDLSKLIDSMLSNAKTISNSNDYFSTYYDGIRDHIKIENKLDIVQNNKGINIYIILIKLIK